MKLLAGSGPFKEKVKYLFPGLDWEFRFRKYEVDAVAPLGEGELTITWTLHSIDEEYLSATYVFLENNFFDSIEGIKSWLVKNLTEQIEDCQSVLLLLQKPIEYCDPCMCDRTAKPGEQRS